MARTKAGALAKEKAEATASDARFSLGTKAARKTAAPPFAVAKQQCKRTAKTKKGAAKGNRKSTNNAATRYIVTSLDEWVSDGFHSYQGPGEREVHGAFETWEEAYAQAEDVFYNKNPWGASVADMKGYRLPPAFAKDTNRGELCAHPEDSTRWTVRVEKVGK